MFYIIRLHNNDIFWNDGTQRFTSFLCVDRFISSPSSSSSLEFQTVKVIQRFIDSPRSILQDQ